MDTDIVFFLVMGVACPVCMGGMLWLMTKHMRHPPKNSLSDSPPKSVSAAAQLAALRAQRERIDAEIAELMQLVDLEAQYGTRPVNRSPVHLSTSAPAASV